MPRLRRWNKDDEFSDAGSRTRAENTRIRRRMLRDYGAELACGEVFQGAQAGVEFGGRQAALAVERAQKAFRCYARRFPSMASRRSLLILV